jgi:hypothetical protein
MSAPLWHHLAVEPSGGLTFRVQSESGAAPHFVDLAARSGAGQCDCGDWRNRVAAGKVDSCKHQRRAWLWLGQRVVQEHVQRDKNQNYQGP